MRSPSSKNTTRLLMECILYFGKDSIKILVRSKNLKDSALLDEPKLGISGSPVGVGFILDLLDRFQIMI